METDLSAGGCRLVSDPAVGLQPCRIHLLVCHAEPVVIDLDREPQRRLRPAPRSVVGSPRTRRTAVVAGILLALLGLRGSSGPLPQLITVAAVDGEPVASYALTPSVMFTTRYSNEPNTSRVQRYSLADGSVEWSVEVPQLAQNLVVSAAERVLMVQSRQAAEFTMLDAVTGAVLWRSTSVDTRVLRVADSGVLMAGNVGGSATLRVLAPRTGAVMWSREVGPVAHLDTGDPAVASPARVVAVDRAGRASVIDFATGGILASTNLGVELPALDQSDPNDAVHVTTTDDRLYVARPTAAVTTLTAYRLNDLRRLWQADGVPAGPLRPCGNVLCVATADGMSVLDALDGSALWSDPRWRSGFDIGVPGVPGRSRLAASGRQQDPQSVLLEPLTGRVLQMTGYSTFADGILLRADAKVAGRAWVGVPDRRGTFRMVGFIRASATNDCHAVAAYLACPASTGAVTVWRIPR